jgi:hypothetical protein
MLKRAAQHVSYRLYSFAQRKAWRRFPDGAFHGDRLNQRVMLELLQRAGVTAFVETGTFKDTVAAFVARHCPEMPVHSIEIDGAYYAEAAAHLAGYPSVHLIHGSSIDGLAALFAGNHLGTRPMFYLDAHWYADWPLAEELRLITQHATPAIIVIDDFQVPGRQAFGFDSYGGRACNLDYISPYLGGPRSHRVALPDYSCWGAFGLGHLERLLRGWAVIFQDLDDLFADVLARPSIAQVMKVADVSRESGADDRGRCAAGRSLGSSASRGAGIS